MDMDKVSHDLRLVEDIQNNRATYNELAFKEPEFLRVVKPLLDNSLDEGKAYQIFEQVEYVLRTTRDLDCDDSDAVEEAIDNIDDAMEEIEEILGLTKGVKV